MRRYPGGPSRTGVLARGPEDNAIGGVQDVQVREAVNADVLLSAAQVPAPRAWFTALPGVVPRANRGPPRNATILSQPNRDPTMSVTKKRHPSCHCPPTRGASMKSSRQVRCVHAHRATTSPSASRNPTVPSKALTSTSCSRWQPVWASRSSTSREQVRHCSGRHLGDLGSPEARFIQHCIHGQRQDPAGALRRREAVSDHCRHRQARREGHRQSWGAATSASRAPASRPPISQSIRTTWGSSTKF